MNSPTDSDSEGHGRAALLLVESLIHDLVANSTLSVSQAVSIVTIALDAQDAITGDAVAPTPSMQKAADLLTALAQSLRIDLPAEEQDGNPSET